MAGTLDVAEQSEDTIRNPHGEAAAEKHTAGLAIVGSQLTSRSAV